MQISSNRLQLRDVQAKDRSDLIHWLHPSHEWHKFNGPYYPPTLAEQIPSMVDNWLSAELLDMRSRLVIVNRETDHLMGMVTRYWISEETHWLAIGIAIYDAHLWSKGFGYEALGLWCEYLFASNPNFVRLDLRTWSGNVGMIRLAEKLGFTQEATFRKARIVDDKYYDGLGYGILREEWASFYADGFAKSLK